MKKKGSPGRLTVEAPLVGDVVHEEDSHRAAVVRRRDCPEPFLTRRVPLRAIKQESALSKGAFESVSL